MMLPWGGGGAPDADDAGSKRWRTGVGRARLIVG